jgi:hypothetical protein
MFCFPHLNIYLIVDFSLVCKFSIGPFLLDHSQYLLVFKSLLVLKKDDILVFFLTIFYLLQDDYKFEPFSTHGCHFSPGRWVAPLDCNSILVSGSSFPRRWKSRVISRKVPQEAWDYLVENGWNLWKPMETYEHLWTPMIFGTVMEI